MFAILILGCGTQTPVVEEPEPVVEEPKPVIEETLPVVIVDEPIVPLQIAAGTVLDGDVDVDPEPLNQSGIVLKFTEDLDFYVADILLGAKSLGWFPLDVIDVRNITNCIHLTPMTGSELLKHNAEYTIEIYAQDLACNGTRIKVKFATKPKRGGIL